MPSTIEKNRICGHTFEVMDYFLFFYDLKIKSEILILENIDPELIYKAYEDKYILPDDYKKYIIFKKRHKPVIADTLLITSGFYFPDRMKIIAKKILIFRCGGSMPFPSKVKNNLLVLQDQRIYNPKNKIDPEFKKILPYPNKHYIKKLYFKRYKKINKNISSNKINKTLIYINSYLRKLDDLNQFFNDNYLLVSGGDFPIKNDYIKVAPIWNLFNNFNTFLYTKTTRQFDCSPRLITESYFYNKKISFDFNFSDYCGPDYGDTGLFWRYFDIINNFDSLDLKENDEILNFI